MSNEILLIDDNVDLLETNEQILKLKGFSIITSNNGKHGLELYQSNHPCMVFSDVKMPDMDGYEFFSKVREIDSSAKIILLTGHEDKEKSIIAKNNGLLDVIIKPIRTDEFVNIIKKNNC